jgi:hypothetical protein
MLNSQVRIQDKQGSNLGTVTLDTWWTAGTGLTGDPFDPRVIYDSLSGRWLAVVDADGGNTTTSRTWLAVSDTNDPTGTWQYYSLDMETPGNNLLWHDFPDIGTNTHWIAITNNMFTAGSSFGGSAMAVIDKTSLGGALTWYRFPEYFDQESTYGTFGASLRPALTHDSSENTLYIVDGNAWMSGGVGLIRLSQVTGVPPSAPTWSLTPDAAAFIPGTGFFLSPVSYNLTQINASQLGTSSLVSTNDPRMLDADFRNGKLWTTHSGGRPFGGTVDRTVAVWYEIDPLLLNTTGTPSVQSGALDPGSGGHYFFPSIAVNSNNDVVLGCSHSDSTVYVEAVVTGRQSGSTAGTMDPVMVIKTGEDSYEKDFGSGSIRWGDYSATVVDPTDNTTFWSIQEYAVTDVGENPSDDRWGTWWAHLSYVNPYLLWAHPGNGWAHLWTLNASLGIVSTRGFALSPGWWATSYHRNSDGSGYLLWTLPGNGWAHLWTLNASLGIVSTKGFAMATNWWATSYHRNADGTSQLLWTHPGNGLAHLWLLNVALGIASTRGYSMAPNWWATSYHRNADGTSQLLWTHPGNGLAHLWMLNLALGIASTQGYSMGANWWAYGFHGSTTSGGDMLQAIEFKMKK